MISVKRLLLALALLLVPTAITQAQQQVNVAPDCNFSFNFSVVANVITAPARVPPSQGGGGIIGFDNRAVACTSWTVVYQADTAISALSLELDSAPNNSGVPGSWTAFTGFPVTTTVQGSGTVTAFFPWVSVTLGSATGTGTVSGRVFGYKPASGGLSGGGGGGSGAAPGLGNPVSNGIYVTTSDILWFQWTGQAGQTIFHTFRIQTATCATGVATGAVYDAVAQGTSWSTTYTSGTAGGQGTGKVFPVCGWLIQAYTRITSAGTPNCAYAQGYILSSMPTGGGTASSVNTFNDTVNGGSLLFGALTSSFYGVGWTVGGGNLVTSPLAGPGCQGNQSISNPGAGADLAATQILDGSSGTPPAHRVLLIAVHFRIVAGSSAGNRQPCIAIGTSAPVTLTTSCAVGIQTAGQTVDYDFEPGVGASCMAGVWCASPLPNNYYLQGIDSFIRTITAGLQSGDQISNIWVKTLYWNEID